MKSIRNQKNVENGVVTYKMMRMINGHFFGVEIRIDGAIKIGNRLFVAGRIRDARQLLQRYIEQGKQDAERGFYNTALGVPWTNKIKRMTWPHL